MIAGTLHQGDLVAPFDYNKIHLAAFNLGPSRRHCLCPLPVGLAQACWRQPVCRPWHDTGGRIWQLRCGCCLGLLQCLGHSHPGDEHGVVWSMLNKHLQDLVTVCWLVPLQCAPDVAASVSCCFAAELMFCICSHHYHYDDHCHPISSRLYVLLLTRAGRVSLAVQCKTCGHVHTFVCWSELSPH